MATFSNRTDQEYEALEVENNDLASAIKQIRNMCEADGVSPTVANIRKLIDNLTYGSSTHE